MKNEKDILKSYLIDGYILSTLNNDDYTNGYYDGIKKLYIKIYGYNEYSNAYKEARTKYLLEKNK